MCPPFSYVLSRNHRNMFQYKQSPSKAEYIAQCRLSLDILWSKGVYGFEEYQETIETLKRAIASAEADSDGI